MYKDLVILRLQFTCRYSGSIEQISCLWRNCTICTGPPDQSMMREEMMVDLENKRHNVINEPIIHWSE